MTPDKCSAAKKKMAGAVDYVKIVSLLSFTPRQFLTPASWMVNLATWIADFLFFKDQITAKVATVPSSDAEIPASVPLIFSSNAVSSMQHCQVMSLIFRTKNRDSLESLLSKILILCYCTLNSSASSSVRGLPDILNLSIISVHLYRLPSGTPFPLLPLEFYHIFLQDAIKNTLHSRITFLRPAQ